jgi:hypothetical protein
MAGYLASLLKRTSQSSEVLRPRPVSLYEPAVITPLPNIDLTTEPEIGALDASANAVRSRARKGGETAHSALTLPQPLSSPTSHPSDPVSPGPLQSGDSPVFPAELPVKIPVAQPGDRISLRADLPVPNLAHQATAAAPVSKGSPVGEPAAKERLSERAEILRPAQLAASPMRSRTPAVQQQWSSERHLRDQHPAQDPEPVVHINIRRVEVNAITQTAIPKTTQPKLYSVMSLDEYLEHRNMEGRK